MWGRTRRRKAPANSVASHQEAIEAARQRLGRRWHEERRASATADALSVKSVALSVEPRPEPSERNGSLPADVLRRKSGSSSDVVNDYGLSPDGLEDLQMLFETGAKVIRPKDDRFADGQVCDNQGHQKANVQKRAGERCKGGVAGESREAAAVADAPSRQELPSGKALEELEMMHAEGFRVVWPKMADQAQPP